MRRLGLGLILALAVTLTLSRSVVQAQQAGPGPATPAPVTTAPAAPAPDQAAPLRISLDLGCDVEGTAESPDTFQYYVWERLNNFGLRVDSTRPIGGEFDRFVQRRAERWTKDQPAQGPATLLLSGRSACDYANAEFFGQAQAHTFRGRVDVELKDAAGARVAQVGFAHEWGRLPQNYTKARTRKEYHQMVHGAVVLWLLSQPQVLAGVPEAKRAELQTFITETKALILHPLEEAQDECEVRTLLQGLPAAPATAPGGH